MIQNNDAGGAKKKIRNGKTAPATTSSSTANPIYHVKSMAKEEIMRKDTLD